MSKHDPRATLEQIQEFIVEADDYTRDETLSSLLSKTTQMVMTEASQGVAVEPAYRYRSGRPACSGRAAHTRARSERQLGRLG